MRAFIVGERPRHLDLRKLSGNNPSPTRPAHDIVTMRCGVYQGVSN